jgi:hypothetical protein
MDFPNLDGGVQRGARLNLSFGRMFARDKHHLRENGHVNTDNRAFPERVEDFENNNLYD